jgi:hypothetical protein
MISGDNSSRELEIKSFIINKKQYSFYVVKNPNENNLWEKVWPSSLILAELLERIELIKVNLGFDLGTGMGHNSIILSKLCKNVVGVDFMQSGLDVGVKSAILNNCENIVRFEKYDWNSWKTLGLSVDILISSDCLYLGHGIRPIVKLTKELLTNGNCGRKIGVFVSECRGYEKDFCKLLLDTFKVELYTGNGFIVILCFQNYSDLLLKFQNGLEQLEFKKDFN